MGSLDKAKALKAEYASRIMARRRLLTFTQRMNPRYLAGWVHEDICRRLERFSAAVAAGESPRLMLLMPPRLGKSELASKMFPAWHLGAYPMHEFIACSYNVSLAMGFSKKIKTILDDPNYQSVFETRLDPENRSSEEWGLTQGGSYVAAGVGGGINGKGAHILVIDDPIKNAEDADSADYRDKLWDWYGSTAYTRLAPGGGVLLIQTFWHDDDLAGRLQLAMANPDSDQFEVIKYPAIAEHDEYLDLETDLIVDAMPEEVAVPASQSRFTLLRRKGEALHPARYDLAKLMRIKQTLTTRFWSALYQQNPVPADGELFTRDQFRTAPAPAKADCNVMIAWDFAISTEKQNDYTVGTVGLQDYDDLLHIPEVLRFKSSDSAFIIESILNLAARWMHPSLVVGFEDGQIFRAIYSSLKKRMRERQMHFVIQVLKAITDKKVRATPLQARMQQGTVRFVLGSWFETVKNELLRFPAGVHDDCVDSLAWLAQLVLMRTAPRKPAAKRLPSWRDQLRQLGDARSHMAA